MRNAQATRRQEAHGEDLDMPSTSKIGVRLMHSFNALSNARSDRNTCGEGNIFNNYRD